MKIMHRSLLISIVPLLTPLTAMAKPTAQPEQVAHAQPTSGASAAWRASDIIGKDVKNASDESVGKIADLAIDLKSGQVLAVVISSGGFLGISDTLSSVPPSAVRYDTTTQSFKTSWTKEQLASAPQSKHSTGADNSARNENDMNSEAITPTNQGTSDADIKTTKDIRSAIIASQLSFNAKNIKVITKDGKVTLRGVVENESEHMALLKIARDHAGPATISDQVSAKTNK